MVKKLNSPQTTNEIPEVSGEFGILATSTPNREMKKIQQDAQALLQWPGKVRGKVAAIYNKDYLASFIELQSPSETNIMSKSTPSCRRPRRICPGP